MFEDVDTAMKTLRTSRRRTCGFTQWIESFDDPADVARANELVDNRSYDCRSLARYFQQKGASFNDQVVSRHRNRRCCQ